MRYFERTLLNYLSRSKLNMEITGFDMDAFSKAMHRELQDRLDTIECIILEDSKTASDANKVAAIKLLFDRGFYMED